MLLADRKGILTVCVYDVNRNGKGEIVRNKVSFVAETVLQITRIDFQGVYSPLSKYSTIRFLISGPFQNIKLI